MRLAVLSVSLLLVAVPAPDAPDAGAAPRATTAAPRAGAAARGKHRRERWKRGQCSSPDRERAFVGRALGPGRVTAEMLVSVRDRVAGADGLRPRRGRSPEERFLVTREVAAALVELRAEVKREFGPDYDIWLNGAFDSTGRARRRHHSMHLSGRAVDLDLYRGPHGGRPGGKVNHLAGELAPVVARVFTRQRAPDGGLLHGWVLHEGNHVHASLESPSVEGRLVAVAGRPPAAAQ